jgi:hypothetical protein
MYDLLSWLAIIAAGAYLAVTLFRRAFLEWDDDCVTVLATPFVDRPSVDKVNI